MEYLNKFGERLQEFIFDKKISVDELSKKLNIHKDDIYTWCKNLSIPNLKNLILLADYFNCSIDYLVGRSGNENSVIFKDCPPFNIRLNFLLEEKQTKMYRICKTKNISKSVFRNWKSGKCEPLIDSLIKLADYFDCTIDYLVGRES